MCSRLTSKDLEVLQQLSACPGAVFGYKSPGTQQAGNYILYVISLSPSSLAAIDYEGSIPRVVPKNIVKKLAKLQILRRIAPFLNKTEASVLDHAYVPDALKLASFEHTKEIGFQIALGTWYKETDEELRRGPG